MTPSQAPVSGPIPAGVSEQDTLTLIAMRSGLLIRSAECDATPNEYDAMVDVIDELLRTRALLREAKPALMKGADGLEDYSEHYAKKKGGAGFACDFDGWAKQLRKIIEACQ